MRFEIFRKHLNVCYKNLEKLYHMHFTGFSDSFVDLWSESHSVLSTSHKGSPRILEWVACPFSSRSSRPRNQTEISCIEGGFFINWTIRDTLVAQLIKNPPAVQQTWVWSLGWEVPLEKGKATYSIILAWRIPLTVWFMGSQRVGHDWATFTFFIDL